MRRHITVDMVRRIAKEGADGRMLVVNATNLDDAGPRVFDLVEEARRPPTRASSTPSSIMMASAGIPGAFTVQFIDQELYVDGGVTGNVLYGGRAEEEARPPSRRQRTYPVVPIPAIRSGCFQRSVRPVADVSSRSELAVSSTQPVRVDARRPRPRRAQHHVAPRVARLKRNADGEIRLVSMPGDWFPPAPGCSSRRPCNLADRANAGRGPGNGATSAPPRSLQAGARRIPGAPSDGVSPGTITASTRLAFATAERPAVAEGAASTARPPRSGSSQRKPASGRRTRRGY